MFKLSIILPRVLISDYVSRLLLTHFFTSHIDRRLISLLLLYDFDTTSFDIQFHSSNYLLLYQYPIIYTVIDPCNWTFGILCHETLTVCDFSYHFQTIHSFKSGIMFTRPTGHWSMMCLSMMDFRDKTRRHRPCPSRCSPK